MERIDDIIMEHNSPSLSRDDYMRMIANELTHPIEQIWRVKLHDDGSIDMYSFAMPRQKNLPAAKCLNYLSLPEWIQKRLSVLQICENGAIVDGVGQKLSDRVYYVIE
jgi:hypothetical protein